MAALQEPGVGNGDIEGESHWSTLAHKHWSRTVKSGRVKPDVIKKDIWDVLEEEGFSLRSLLQLESLQLLEKYMMSRL